MAAAVASACATAACGVAVAIGANAPAQTAAANRAAAARDTAVLLGRLRLPASAVQLTSEPPGDKGYLARPSLLNATTLNYDRHTWWRIPMAMANVIAYIRGAAPRGGKLTTSGGGTDIQLLAYEWPAVPQVLSARQLVIAVTPLPGGVSGLRADAADIWVMPRAASEKVPAGVVSIGVTQSGGGLKPFSHSITSATQISRIVAAINGLPTVQPGVIACPADPTGAAHVAFTFRGRNRAVLAQAAENADVVEPTDACDPLSFSIRGRRQTPLLRGAWFLEKVQSVAGFKVPAAG